MFPYIEMKLPAKPLSKYKSPDAEFQTLKTS